MVVPTYNMEPANLPTVSKLRSEEISPKSHRLDFTLLFSSNQNGSVARFKKGGGHGGHNGLRSIIEQLGTKDFMRLRIGVGHPGHASMVSGFVLSKAPQSEEDAIFDAIDAARRVLPEFVAGEYEKAMNELHRK